MGFLLSFRHLSLNPELVPNLDHPGQPRIRSPFFPKIKARIDDGLPDTFSSDKGSRALGPGRPAANAFRPLRRFLTRRRSPPVGRPAFREGATVFYRGCRTITSTWRIMPVICSRVLGQNAILPARANPPTKQQRDTRIIGVRSYK